MRILLTNDDGIDSPGLHALRQIAAELSGDVWIVAPETNQSGASHSLTLHEPLRLRQIDERARNSSERCPRSVASSPSRLTATRAPRRSRSRSTARCASRRWARTRTAWTARPPIAC
jgi:5'/3'-nucleotidase SurE